MKDFLFFITDENGRSYYERNGVIDSSSQPKILPETSDGWQEMAVAWERNINDVGTIRNFSTPLHFVRTGRKILLDIFFRNNIEKKVYLLIKKLALEMTVSTYFFIYRFFYKGALDFSTLEDDGEKATISIMESGIVQQYKANRNTVYEIPFENYEVVEMDGINIEYSAAMETLAESYRATNTLPTLSQTKKYIISQFDKSVEQSRIYVSVFPVYKTEYTDITQSEDYFLSTSDNVVLEMTFKFKAVVSRSTSGIPPTGNVKVLLRKGNDTTVHTFINQNAVGSASFDINETIMLTVDKGEKLYLVAEVQLNSGIGYLGVDIAVGTIDIKYEARFTTTYVKGLTPSTLLKALTKRITGNELNCDTSFLDTHSNILVTSGDAIRGVTQQTDAAGNIILKNPVVKTSLDQFFQFCRAVFGAGIGIENNKIVIDEYSHFLDYSNPVDLGEVRDFKWSYASDLAANVVKIGYPDQNIDDVNGKYEFNNTHSYSLPITRVSKELGLSCPYLAQPYLIESRRAGLEKTTDNQQDNDIFIINTTPGGIQNIATEALFDATLNYISIPSTDKDKYFLDGIKFTVSGTASNDRVFTVSRIETGVNVFNIFVKETVVTEALNTQVTFTLPQRTLTRVSYTKMVGIPDSSQSSIFNIEELTPKRLLKKQLSWVNSVCWGFQGQNITYNTTEKNAQLYTERNGSYVDEDGNLSVTGDKLFIPIYFDFEALYPVDLVDTLETSPTRCFQFSCEGKTFKGFLMKAGLAASTDQQQTFKLLATPDTSITDLMELIDG